ncbi:hypothetical protein LZ554_005471 [Drepanopeziza brunnea f. sp. 'monogermtubi']|nr:hypothetical protein LZ554_005471 [Drepanopeziza brunnea f. sp. 'monogermtubi']
MASHRRIVSEAKRDQFRVIGVGSFADIYRVGDTDIAFKIAFQPEEPEQVPEKQIYERLGTSHPYILRSYGEAESVRGRGLMLQYLPTGMLAKYLDLKNFPKERTQWPVQAAEAIRYTHSKRVIHCDIGAHNFLIQEDGSLALADFWESSLDGSSATVSTSTRYSRPLTLAERILDQTEVDDIFALGSFMYEVSVGHRVYAEKSDNEIYKLFERREFPDKTGIDENFASGNREVLARPALRTRPRYSSPLYSHLPQFSPPKSYDMSGQGEPEAPAAKAEDLNNSVISIKGKYQNEAEMFFKIKTKAKLGKVFNAYCDRAGLQRSTVRFLLDGSRVQEEDTPETLQLEDGDMIDAMLEQLGGEGTPSADDKLKTSEAKAPVHIEIRVKDQHGSEVTFKIKRTTPLEKVMDAFCSRQEIGIKSVRFLFEGQRVQPTDTPILLEMEDEDVIEVFVEQLGGEVIELPLRPKPITPEQMEVQPLAASEMLRIIFKNGTGDEVTFLMKKSATFDRLFAAYCRRLEISTTSVRFLWKGSRVQPSDTPASLTFEDGEIFEVFKEQGGPDPINATAKKQVAGPVIPEIITVVLVNGDFGQHIHKHLFQLKLTTKLRRLMDVYCERQGVERHMVRFIADGTRLCDDDTPQSLGLEENHMIEVFTEQIGGGAEEGDDAAAGDEQVAKPKAHKLSIKVVNDRGEEVVFQCRPTTLLQKLVDTYCASKDRKPGSLRFFSPGGQRLTEGSTPASLGMKDGDIIDVHEEQQGGAF